jgi:hypothetical protein
MSFGDGLYENAYAKERLARLTAKADAARAARQARCKPFLSRLRDRQRQQATGTHPATRQSANSW